MGTDIYHCNLESHLVLDAEAALARALSYGVVPVGPYHPLEKHAGPFLELTMTMRSVYNDAPVAWDPLMLLRMVDEAVMDQGYGDPRYAYENTPLARRYAGFWGMGFASPEPLANDVLLLQVEHADPPSPPGPRRDWTDDWARVVFMVPQSLAPNLEGAGSWDSRAWGGSNYEHEDQIRRLRPWSAELRRAAPTRVIKMGVRHSDRTRGPVSLKGALLAPRPGGGLWAVAQGLLCRVSEDGDRGEEVAELPQPAKKVTANALVVDGEGTVWIGLSHGLCRFREGEGVALVPEVSDRKEVHGLAVGSDGRVLVGGVGGLWIQGEAGWTHVRDGLTDRAVLSVAIDGAGCVWTAGTNGLTRRDPSGALAKLQRTQGVYTRPEMIRLPDGALYVSAYGGCGRLAAGGDSVEPHASLDAALRVAPRMGALAPDGALWVMAAYGLVIRLVEGAQAEAFAMDALMRSDPPARLAVAANGDLWFSTSEGLLRWSVADQAAARATPPLRPVPASPLRLTPPARPRVRVDFTGKSVALTGTLTRLSRDEAAALLRAHGATVVGSVSSKTDYLIAGKGAGSKADKAAALGVKVLGEDALPTGEADQGGEGVPELSDTDKKARFPRWTGAPAQPTSMDLALMRTMALSGEALSAEAWAATLAKHAEFLARGGGGGRFENLTVSGLLLTIYLGCSEEVGALQAGPRFARLEPGTRAEGVNLSWASLGGLVAPGINLRGASLVGAMLIGADLSGADLSGADLSGADLSDVDLRGADLRGATLNRTDFERADLSGADLRGTRTTAALFPYTRLDGVKL